MVLSKVRTPGNRIVRHKRREKTSKHVCGLCGSVLSGVPRGKGSEIKKMTHSQRKPSRPFGGQLCSRCTRNIIKLRAKLNAKLIEQKDVPIRLRSYV